MACAVSLFRRVTDIVILWVDGYRVITAADGRRGDRVRAAHLLRPDPARPLPPEGGRHPDDQGAAQLSHGAVDADHRRVGRKTNSCTLRRSLPVRISLSRNPASRTSCRQPSGHSSARTVGVKARGRAALNSAPEEYLPIYRLRAQARPPCRRSQKKPRTT